MTSVINDAPSSNFSHQSVNQSGSKFVLIKQEEDKQNVSKLVVGNDIGEKDFKSRIKSLFTFMDNKHDEIVNYDHLLSYLHRNVDNDIKGLVNGEKTMEHLPTEEKDGPFLWLLSVKEKGFPFFPGSMTVMSVYTKLKYHSKHIRMVIKTVLQQHTMCLTMSINQWMNARHLL
jgi:hypothetical protein